MFDISKYAKGLPSLMGFKDRGKGPPLFSDQVVGTVELADLYLLEGREAQFSTTMNAAVQGVNFFTPDLVVPAGELWYVWEYFVVVTTGVGDAVTFIATVNLDGLLISAPRSNYEIVSVSQTARTIPLRPFWAGAGTRFGFNVKSITAAPVFQGGLLATKLKI